MLPTLDGAALACRKGSLRFQSLLVSALSVVAKALHHAEKPMSQLLVDRAILEMLHKRAASVAYRASYIADAELADEVDAIAHELSELLGDPHLRVGTIPDACPWFEADDVTRTDLVTHGGAAAFVKPEVPAASCTPWLSLPAAERPDELTPAFDPPRFVAASTDEPTRPRVRRLRTMHGRPRRRAGQAATRQVGAARVPTSEESRLPTGWVRGATITALIALVGVIAILSACTVIGGAR